jgi:uncharacterized protein (DUF2237 family)
VHISFREEQSITQDLADHCSEKMGLYIIVAVLTKDFLQAFRASDKNSLLVEKVFKSNQSIIFNGPHPMPEW